MEDIFTVVGWDMPVDLLEVEMSMGEVDLKLMGAMKEELLLFLE